jgi:hypothetical protein
MLDKYKHTYAERNALRRDLKRILANNDELELMRILRKYGIKDEDSRFSEIVQSFRDLRSGKTEKKKAEQPTRESPSAKPAPSQAADSRDAPE